MSEEYKMNTCLSIEGSSDKKPIVKQLLSVRLSSG
jgi:hypothetical protein